MNEVENLKDIKNVNDIKSTLNDYEQCIDYMERIHNGENILLEACLFVNNKIYEVALKSPEIIQMNGVHRENTPINTDSVFKSLCILEGVLCDELKKEGIEFLEDNNDKNERI